MILADIATGNTGTADVLFLIAAILFGLAALLVLVRLRPPATGARPVPAVEGFFLYGGLCLVAIGWLVL